MTEKVKITQEQADFIEKSLANGIDKEEMLNKFATTKTLRGSAHHSLHGLCVMDLARALLIGYEIEPEFKVGDWVISKITGDIGKVTRIKQNGDVVTDVKLVACRDDLFLTGKPTTFEKKTSDEIAQEKERRLWKSIGREFREFRNGDAYSICDEKGTLGASTRVIGEFPQNTPATAKKMLEEGFIWGFYPAESFISFEEGEAND